MTTQDIANWISLYVATFVCCGLGMMFTVPVVGAELWRDEIWRDATTTRGALLLLPRVWWRWQRKYLLSTPVTLMVVASYAMSLHW